MIIIVFLTLYTFLNRYHNQKKISPLNLIAIIAFLTCFIFFIKLIYLALIVALIIKVYPIIIQNHHTRKINVYCIDFLDSFIRHLKSGNSRENAFLISYQSSHPFLQNYLSSIITGIQRGDVFSKLLYECALTIRYKTLKEFLISIQTSIESGQSLLKQMNFLLRRSRQSYKIKKKLKAMATQSKLQAYTCIALPLIFALILYIIAPEFISPLFQHSFGHLSLGISFVLLSLGSYWIFLLTHKDYI